MKIRVILAAVAAIVMMAGVASAQERNYGVGEGIKATAEYGKMAWSDCLDQKCTEISATGVGGTKHTWNLEHYPKVIKTTSFGSRAVTFSIDVDKKTLAISKASLDLDLSEISKAAGRTVSASELPAILKEVYMQRWEAMGEPLDGLSNSLLVNEEMRSHFVREDIPAIIGFARNEHRKPWDVNEEAELARREAAAAAAPDSTDWDKPAASRQIR